MNKYKIGDGVVMFSRVKAIDYNQNGTPIYWLENGFAYLDHEIEPSPIAKIKEWIKEIPEKSNAKLFEERLLETGQINGRYKELYKILNLLEGGK